MQTTLNSNRRRFLKQTGVIVSTFTLAGPAAIAQQSVSLPGGLNNNRMLDGWVRINSNNTVTVFTGKCEIGQGILTALAQIAADELDVAYERVEIVSADTARTPNEGMTVGSLSVENSGTALRFACAEARALLLAAAARKLNVAVEKLSVNDGAISASPVRMTYWDVAKDVSFKREATASAKPKPASQHKVIGRNVPRRDLPSKVTGGAAFVQDMRLPGMVFGRVVRPPSYRATLQSVDEAVVKAMPGVVAVTRDGNFLAVAAEREEQVIKAAQALRASAKWNETPDLPPGGSGNSAALYEHLKKMPSRDSVIKSVVPVAGNGSNGGRITTVEAEYTRPFQAHGSIGPSCAVAQFKDGKYQVWTHTQGVFPLRTDLAKALKITVANVTCTHVEGSGCYGHNGADDVACDAALLSRATNGRPVKLQWMREDEFQWEPYGSAMIMKMQAQLDESKHIVGWQHEIWSHPHNTRPTSNPAGSFVLGGWHLANPAPPAVPNNGPQPAGAADRNAVPLYDFPRQNVLLHYLTDMPVRVSALRGLGAYANIFALESFIDEVAAVAGEDPVVFRLKHMKNPRARAVIELAAEKAGWKTGAKGNGTTGRGIAFAQYKNLACYCAVVADVSVDRAGNVRVTRAVSAVDAGLVINPDGIINQIEGGIIQSASWTLKEQVKFDRQRITTRSWADYPIFTFNDVPEVEVHLINRPEERPLGTGEGSQGPAVAAIANAIAHATGKRLRDLPFTPDKLRTT
jgi:CO/xanthine dehydrogenase Mo-binding subunit